MTQTPEDLIRAAIKLLAHYARRPSTSLLREAAPIIVELRSRCALRDGRTDWSGRSREYHDYITDIYEGTGMSARDLSKLQSTLMYHVGNALRDRAKTEDLRAVGMAPTTPRDRACRGQQAYRELLAKCQAAGLI